MTEADATLSPPDEPWMELTASRGFAGWLAENDVSLAFSTYQSGKLFLLGRNAQGELSIFERTFARCMGLWAEGQTLWMTSLYQIWRFENALSPGEPPLYPAHRPYHGRPGCSRLGLRHGRPLDLCQHEVFLPRGRQRAG